MAGMSIVRFQTEETQLQLQHSFLDWPVLSADQVREQWRERERQLIEARDHLQKDTREHHVRDLPSAYAAGVQLEWAHHYQIYLPTYPNVREMGKVLYGIGPTQQYTYRGIARGLLPDWLVGWDKPKGIETAAVAASAPVCVRELLFFFIRDGKSKKAIIRGVLAAEDAISEDREDEAGAWARRAVLGESTEYERKVRQARGQEKRPRRSPRAKALPTAMQQVGSIANMLQMTAGGIGQLEVLLDQQDPAKLDAEGVERLIALSLGVSHKLDQLRAQLLAMLPKPPSDPMRPVPPSSPGGPRPNTRKVEREFPGGTQDGGAGQGGETGNGGGTATGGPVQETGAGAKAQDTSSGAAAEPSSGTGKAAITVLESQTGAKDQPGGTVTTAPDSPKEEPAQSTQSAVTVLESQTGEPAQDATATGTATPVSADPPPRPAPEPWWGEPFTRALLGVLDEPEREEMQLLLVRALRGVQPAPLMSFIRARISRLSEIDPEVREDLAHWMKCSCNWNLEKRWPYLYMFFITAQLPHFLLFLHGLALDDLPASCIKVLHAACKVFPAAPPPVIPEGATEEEAQWIRFDHAAMVANQTYHEAMAVPFGCDVELLAKMWEQVCDTRDFLLKLVKRMAPPEGHGGAE